jgi:hypothetical protein
MHRLAILSLPLLALCGCILHEYTADASRSPQVASAVNHCFRLRSDAYVIPARRTIELEKPANAKVEVFGGFVARREDASDGDRAIEVPKGTELVVDRVLANYMPQVGARLRPYVRLGSQFDGLEIDVSNLFEQTWEGREPLLPVPAYLERCDGDSR